MACLYTMVTSLMYHAIYDNGTFWYILVLFCIEKYAQEVV